MDNASTDRTAELCSENSRAEEFYYQVDHVCSTSEHTASNLPDTYDAARYLQNALHMFYEVATRGIRDTVEAFDELLVNDPDRIAADWSIRVSEDGLELMNRPYVAWMEAANGQCPGFTKISNQTSALTSYGTSYGTTAIASLSS